MGILVVNSDFEKLWNEPYPEIAFDNATYSLAGEVGTTLSASFAIFDNYDADVTDQCEITLDNDNVSIEDGMFVCDDLEVGTYQTIVTATYSYLSATVTATATINISVEEEQPTSISFNSATYSMSGNEDETLTQAFSVSDDLSNDVTALCSYSFSPNDKGLYVDSGNFKVDSAIAGTYDITVTATYGELTNTATISVSVVDLPNSISFDSNSYTLTGTEYETITQSFTVTDDLNNDLTSQCSYTLSPNDTGLTASNGTFDASSVTAGTYSVTVTATYAARNLTATATISMDIASATPDYSTRYFTMEALQNGTTFQMYIPVEVDSTKMTSVSYSTDNGTTWTTTAIDNTRQTITITGIKAGDKVLWKGVGSTMGGGTAYNKCVNVYSNNAFNVEGNIMSLLYGDNFANQTTFASGSVYNFSYLFNSVTALRSAENLVLPVTSLTNQCYSNMFKGCPNLTTAPALPATTLENGCYMGMFQNCTSLTTAPVLPATTLATWCYGSMFYQCLNLTTVPALPATTLAANCCQDMFNGCTSLTTAPELSATTLANSCYYQMFYNCTSLTTAPTLPATTLVAKCYSNMFKGCTSLTTIPSNMLPATTLVAQCYSNMFDSCTSLTTVPSNMLPATTLYQDCYKEMFKGCTSLTTAPSILPATTLVNQCYQSMFQNCTALTTAPELSATTLAGSCYVAMFYNCTSLTTAPTLSATTLAYACYNQMFYNCTNLNSITMLATDISAANCLSNWVNGVQTTSGTFTKAASMTTLPTGVNGIPENWTVVDAS